MAVTHTAYQRAVAILDAAEPRGMKPGLERTSALLEALDNPHLGLHGVLVAGTNGKGSVCTTVDSIVRAAGIHTVALTKPHLTSYCERFVVDGVQVSEQTFADAVETVIAAAGRLPDALEPTAFEMLTAAGFHIARQARADVVVCEVGLGGRLDSTNVVDLGVAVITNVGLDHRDRLGDTVEAIAAEKAAIIKPGDVGVTAAQQPALDVIRERARTTGARLVELSPQGTECGLDGVEVNVEFAAERLRVRAPLIGQFQVANVATAVAVCDALREAGHAIGPAAVASGCASVTWPARMQWFASRPGVLLDGAHNPPGIAAMVASARTLFGGRRMVTVFAAMRDKDAEAMVRELRALPSVATVVTAPAVERSTPPEELARLIGEQAIAVATAPRALETARRLAGADGVVVACGSLYLAGELLEVLRSG